MAKKSSNGPKPKANQDVDLDKIIDAEEIAPDVVEDKSDTTFDVEPLDPVIEDTEDEVPETVDTETEKELIGPVEQTEAVEEEQVPVNEPTLVVQKSSGFLPMLIGGVIAASLGYLAAYMSFARPDTSLNDQLNAQADQIDVLSNNVAAIPAVDLSALENIQSDLSAQMDVVNTEIASLSDRIAVIERQPSSDGTLQETALIAYQQELDTLKAQMEDVAGRTIQQLEDVRSEAAEIEENANEAVWNAAIEATRRSLETGAPISPELDQLRAISTTNIPDELTAVADGVPTLQTLQSEYPDVARAALVTARRENVSGEASGGIGSFLRNQFDVRSVTPTEGSSVDAILSRAEAALNSGRLNDTLAELDALPEIVKAEMSDWLAKADARTNALSALNTLSDSFNDN